MRITLEWEDGFKERKFSVNLEQLYRYLAWREDHPELVEYWLSVGIAPDDFLWDDYIDGRRQKAFENVSNFREFWNNEQATLRALWGDDKYKEVGLKVIDITEELAAEEIDTEEDTKDVVNSEVTEKVNHKIGQMSWTEIMLQRYLEWKEDYPHLVNYWMSVGIAPDDFMWKSQENLDRELELARRKAPSEKEFWRNYKETIKTLFPEDYDEDDFDDDYDEDDYY